MYMIYNYNPQRNCITTLGKLFDYNIIIQLPLTLQL